MISAPAKHLKAHIRARGNSGRRVYTRMRAQEKGKSAGFPRLRSTLKHTYEHAE